MIIAEKIEVSEEIFASSGFADVRPGKYMGTLVAVKSMRVAAQDDLSNIRKVSVDVGHTGRGLNRSITAILQGGRPLEHDISPERHETRRGLRRHGQGRVRHRFRVDETWEHHGLRQEQSYQQAGVGTWLHFPHDLFC